jgi:nickel transport protein
MNFKLTKIVRAVFWIVVCTLLLTGNALAHRVSVFAWVQGDTVHVESKFSGGKKVKGGRIVVTDSGGIELLTGKTDNSGEFSFKIPRRTDLTIILEAGMGHRAEWTVPADDMGSIAAEDQTPPEKHSAKKEPEITGAAQHEQHGSMRDQVPTGPGLAEIETVVEKALDKKLKPVLKMLAESAENRPTIRDIIGGIGYIIGLVGMAAYLRYRKRDVVNTTD